MKLMRDMYFTIYNREQTLTLPISYQRDKGCHKIHALINILLLSIIQNSLCHEHVTTLAN